VNLFENTYIQDVDVLERNNIKNEKEVLDDVIRIVASSVGSLTNPYNIAKYVQVQKKYFNQFKYCKPVPWTDDFGINYVGVREFLSGHYIDLEMV